MSILIFFFKRSTQSTIVAGRVKKYFDFSPHPLSITTQIGRKVFMGSERKL
jgi:hypothetical protein